ncbi:hypothetical protein HELRODRAFT_165397 [Helobdella robusta]|uniref:Uncharacterized protein n=1 Tax=Helobdella robusta TaxID=6412 RepID=T1EWP9_HELRO|nr:hypothetical protein HELRODRAFT_165397 [Helobdella robusta]ESN91367.1 hypothetical protein HELRODRAFT_165397 [Helobdella robusta]
MPKNQVKKTTAPSPQQALSGQGVPKIPGKYAIAKGCCKKIQNGPSMVLRLGTLNRNVINTKSDLDLIRPSNVLLVCCYQKIDLAQFKIINVYSTLRRIKVRPKTDIWLLKIKDCGKTQRTYKYWWLIPLKIFQILITYNNGHPKFKMRFKYTRQSMNAQSQNQIPLSAVRSIPLFNILTRLYIPVLSMLHDRTRYLAIRRFQFLHVETLAPLATVMYGMYGNWSFCQMLFSSEK